MNHSTSHPVPTFNSPRRGFTIVELLIVVVVIAILAAITIVSYNGITTRAYNVKIVAGVRVYLEQIELYRATQGAYPRTGPEEAGEDITMVCLGSGYSNETCGHISNTTVNEDSFFNNEMATFIGSNIPKINDQSLPSGPESFVGAAYGIDQTAPSTGFSRARTIQYALHGADANCMLSGAWAYRLSDTPPVTACEIILEGIDP